MSLLTRRQMLAGSASLAALDYVLALCARTVAEKFPQLKDELEKIRINSIR